MKEKDRQEFARLMAGLGELFEKSISKTLLEIYWMALSPYSIEQVKKAINQAVITCKFFPKPAEIIELIEGKKEDQALEAWEVLLNAIRRVGGYDSVVFEDGRIARAVEIMGGWENVTLWTTDELKYRQQEFIRIFKTLPQVSPQKVAGIIERVNAAKGMLPKPNEPTPLANIVCPITLVSKEGQKPLSLPESKKILEDKGAKQCS